MAREEAVSELDQAHMKQARTALYDLAVNVRSTHPDATEVHLSQSDQGDWMGIDCVVTPGGKVRDYDDPESNDSCLYTDVWVLREHVFSSYDVRGVIEYTPRMGLISFHLDVAKVLVECKPEPAPTWPTTPEDHQAYHSWQAEVGNGDTILGFREWLKNQEDQD